VPRAALLSSRASPPIASLLETGFPKPVPSTQSERKPVRDDRSSNILLVSPRSSPSWKNGTPLLYVPHYERRCSGNEIRS